MERHQGFTLIEVSIVLVIVGLLAGGVLAGQELIRASTLRSIMSQKEEIETATNTFRNKYNGIPGDLANATAFGFSANGNGDGKIGQYPGFQYNEVWQFFKQLAEAGMMPGKYSGTNGPGGVRHAVPGTNVLASRVPKAGFTVVGWFGYTSINDYTPKAWAKIQMHAIQFGTSDGHVYETYAPVLSASDAMVFDNKFDDGKPASGNFVTIHYWGCTTSLNSAITQYNVANPSKTCSYFIRANF